MHLALADILGINKAGSIETPQRESANDQETSEKDTYSEGTW
jgi:hypothetical protein